MKRTKTKSHGELVARELNRDDVFRAEWEKTELARVVAAQVIGYRTDHALSQRKLAAKLGIKQPQVARLESGEQNPAIETLIMLSSKLGIEFMIDITPTKKTPKLITKAVASKHPKQERDGAAVVYAATS
jgi:ribosome-binding protein aMBF1 (putative translation factor)